MGSSRKLPGGPRAGGGYALLWLGAICAQGACASRLVGQVTDRLTRSPDRVVHRFDFDERAEGNLEDVPKYWELLRPPGFPHFSHGEFDPAVGQAAAPSFHLVSEGRNVAYQYSGLETRVRMNTDYRIEGYVKADHLMRARACLSAHFLDKNGLEIDGTLVRSRFVGGANDSDGWVHVTLHLASAPRDAYTVGLVAWVMQEPTWNTAAPPRWHIPRRDVRAGAWFDDITIFALPHVSIASSATGNVMVPDELQELLVVLADNEDPTLRGRLTILSAGGQRVEEHEVPVVMESRVVPKRISVGHLTPGLYIAVFDVFAGSARVVSRSLTFARVAAPYRESEAHARPFGVVVDPRERADPATELVLLRRQLARSAKLPVWTGLPDDPPTAGQRLRTDRLLQGLTKAGFALTGVFFGPPSTIVRSDGAYVRPLVELLANDPTVWQDHLASVVAPYASSFRWWQMGADEGWPLVVDKDFPLAVERLRDGIRRFITLPRLAAVTSTAFELPEVAFPVEQLALSVRANVQPDAVALQLAAAKDAGYAHVSVYLAPVPSDRYGRLPRLTDWAQRVISARHAGADTVFVPQTWQVRDTGRGRRVEPTETFLFLRTMADVIGRAAPAQRLHLGRDIKCLAFRAGADVVLAMWAPMAPPGGRDYPIQLGGADRQIDMWGRAAPLLRDEHGRSIVHLTAMPVLVDRIEPWLIDFRASLSLKPSRVESGTESVPHELEMAYRGARAVSGRVELGVPRSWGISPRVFSFSLMPQRTVSYPIRIRYPHSAPAGRREVLARITLEGSSRYFEVPLVVNLGVKDLEVSGSGVVEGEELVLRHIVTNRSSKVLSFRGSAVVPGRQRQYRPISHLKPGDTQTVEYRFARGGALVGRPVRLVLREMNDGPRVHNLELTIP